MKKIKKLKNSKKREKINLKWKIGKIKFLSGNYSLTKHKSSGMKYVEFESGIYCIFSSEGNALFMAGASNIKNRFAADRSLLSKRMHQNEGLQDYYNQDPDLLFIPIMYCDVKHIKHNLIVLTNALRPEFNQKQPKQHVNFDPPPPEAVALMQQFCRQTVPIETVVEFMKQEGIFDTVHNTGKLISRHKLAKVQRNWKEGGRYYYAFY